MKNTIQIAGLSVGFLAVLPAHGQSTFLNLNFEQANPVPVIGSPFYPYEVTVASALPDWMVYLDGVQQSQMLYNDITLGAPSVDLIGSPNNVYINPIDGNYSVFLQAFAPGDTASISQTALIPFGTQSLFFEAQPGSGPLEVFVGNQAVALSTVGTGANYTLYGANISAWADDPETITFSVSGGTPNGWELDDISFSTTAVPEPSIGALAAIGGLLFGARKYFARRR
jgi:hypothetical protein